MTQSFDFNKALKDLQAGKDLNDRVALFFLPLCGFVQPHQLKEKWVASRRNHNIQVPIRLN